MRRWIIIANLVVLLVLLLTLGLLSLLEDDRDGAPVDTGQVSGIVGSPVGGGELLAGKGPLLDFEEPYLRGRGEWFRGRYADLRKELSQIKPGSGSADSYTTVVLRSPITGGSWLEGLSPESVSLRETSEGQIVEARALFNVPGVKPLDLLVYLMCSDFKVQIPNDSMDRMDHRFPGEDKPGECLGELPGLKANQVLSHEVWEPEGFLRKGTDIWFINELRREGDCYYFVYRLLKSCQPTESYTPVRLATGQYAALATDSGSLVLLKSYYNGQSIPRLSDFLVRSRTNAFYKGIATFLAEQVPVWKPPENAKAWRAGLGVD